MFKCIVIFITCTILILPLIHVPVIIHSRGIIRPENEIADIISPISGIIEECLIQEGAIVNKNDTLLIFNTLRFNNEYRILTERKALAEKYIRDLSIMVNGDSNLFTEKYRSEYATYNLILEEKRSREQQIFSNMNRLIPLWRDSLISRKEVEDMEFQFMLAQNETQKCISSYISGWINEAVILKNEIMSMDEKSAQIRESLSRSVITSPVNGVVLKTNGLVNGGFISQHQKIIQITPDTGYYAEIYINPSDIGWIKPESKGRILIDAFNSNYWRALEAECNYISDDIHWVNNQPFYLAKCKIEYDEVISERGYHSTIKKGMTLTVQFVITERSIFQLLTGNWSHWFSPSYGVK